MMQITTARDNNHHRNMNTRQMRDPLIGNYSHVCVEIRQSGESWAGDAFDLIAARSGRAGDARVHSSSR